jgi:hypothetical protein
MKKRGARGAQPPVMEIEEGKFSKQTVSILHEAAAAFKLEKRRIKIIYSEETTSVAINYDGQEKHLIHFKEDFHCADYYLKYAAYHEMAHIKDLSKRKQEYLIYDDLDLRIDFFLFALLLSTLSYLLPRLILYQLNFGHTIMSKTFLDIMNWLLITYTLLIPVLIERKIRKIDKKNEEIQYNNEYRANNLAIDAMLCQKQTKRKKEREKNLLAIFNVLIDFWHM